MEEKRTPAENRSAYDPDFWTAADRMTAGMLKKVLEKIPDDATVHCCGTSPVYLHYAPGTKALSLDCEDLAGLPEYEGREPRALKGPEE